ncbi:hypothetical protein [Paenibacillus polymyxa]|uniref:hypothetical protein n=1 Tax=Paenibacillus polymyxa TaxID=1406 RepID=UPI00030DF6EB|nr:hypothetical protein [Paenibacillus polymyxa]MCC3257476.1 hypothetical protein [Paenibacillus polymyxa]
MRSWSDFGKGLKEAVRNQLQINLENLDIPSYNHIILDVIKSEVEKSIHSVGVAKMQENLQELLGTKREEVNFSELIKEMVEDECELNELDYEEVQEITVHVDADRRVLSFIYFDPEPDKSQYNCKYRLVLDKEGYINSVEIADKSFDKKTIMGGLYGLEATLFKLYTHGSKVIMDDYETEFSNPEHE